MNEFTTFVHLGAITGIVTLAHDMITTGTFPKSRFSIICHRVGGAHNLQVCSETEVSSKTPLRAGLAGR